MTTTYTAARAKRLILDGKLAANAKVEGDLDLSGTSITALPEGLTVGGGLYLSGTSITVPTNWIGKPGEATRHRAIAIDPEYTLMQSDIGKYSAGCRGPWTKKQALDHWGRSGRTDARAKAFVAAIEAHHIAEAV